MGCEHSSVQGAGKGRVLQGFAPFPKSSRAVAFCCGIPNISDQIKVAENTRDLSGLVGGGARVKRSRPQGLEPGKVCSLQGACPGLYVPIALSPCNPAGLRARLSRLWGGGGPKPVVATNPSTLKCCLSPYTLITGSFLSFFFFFSICITSYRFMDLFNTPEKDNPGSHSFVHA